MTYTSIGRTGVKVSPLCFGTMTFGDTTDEETSAEIYQKVRNAGINFFDCANVYAGGKSEEILGNLIYGEREQLIITSKVHGAMSNDINDRGLSRKNIVKACEQSLKRLKTDYLDFYFLHQFDPEVPIEESLKALDDLVRHGMILYPAVSNWAAWQIVKATGISAKRELARFELIQPMYNLLKRQAEVEILPMALSEEIGVVPYNPMAAGMLTGKYNSKNKPKDARITVNLMYAKRYSEASYLTTAKAFTKYAKEKGVEPAMLAVAWVKAHPAVTAPIFGARKVEQLDAPLKALNFKMSQKMYDEIAALSPEPPLAHDRSEER